MGYIDNGVGIFFHLISSISLCILVSFQKYLGFFFLFSFIQLFAQTNHFSQPINNIILCMLCLYNIYLLTLSTIFCSFLLHILFCTLFNTYNHQSRSIFISLPMASELNLICVDFFLAQLI